MAEDIKASVVDEESPSAAEKEQEVLENSGVTVGDDGTYKLDLTKINEQENAVQEQETEDGVLRSSEQSEETGQEAEVGLQEVRQEEVESPVLEEVTDEQEASTDETAVVAEQEESKVEPVEEQKEEINLPENIEDLVNFMKETGGSLEDYVRLNADYSGADEKTLLSEYYKRTKPHLSYDEIQFLMDDNFSYDDQIDEERDIKRKKLALKEEVANAKDFLTGLKDQYYKEVKLGSKLAPEQQKAIDFFNKYTEEQKSADDLLAKQTTHFKQQTENVFNENFKGFNFEVGDKKYRFNVKDVNKVKESQNLSSVFDKYVDENNLLTNASGFHKALFAASNPDAIANHFYEQGKADAVKQMSAEAKNINMDPRKTSDGYVESGGMKIKAVSGDSKSGLKIKLKNY